MSSRISGRVFPSVQKKAFLVRVIDPIRGEPIDNIVVARDSDELRTDTTDGLTYRKARCLGDLSIYDGGKLVKYDEIPPR